MIPQWKRGMYGTEENTNTEDPDCSAVVCSDALVSDESIMSSDVPTKSCAEEDWK